MYLIVDVGLYGLGVMLAQKQSDSTIRPIHFDGRTLTSAGRNQSQIEKKALANIWG